MSGKDGRGTDKTPKTVKDVGSKNGGIKRT